MVLYIAAGKRLQLTGLAEPQRLQLRPMLFRHSAKGLREALLEDELVVAAGAVLGGHATVTLRRCVGLGEAGRCADQVGTPIPQVGTRELERVRGKEQLETAEPQRASGNEHVGMGDRVKVVCGQQAHVTRQRLPAAEDLAKQPLRRGRNDRGKSPCRCGTG